MNNKTLSFIISFVYFTGFIVSGFLLSEVEPETKRAIQSIFAPFVMAIEKGASIGVRVATLFALLVACVLWGLLYVVLNVIRPSRRS